MKKLIIIFFVISMVAMPAGAQLALKGGITYTKGEFYNYLVTCQFHKELLALSADLSIPTRRNINEVSYGGRMGIGLGDETRFVADIGATYEKQNWRCGYGIELNLKLYASVGMFVRFANTYPISKSCNHNKILWKCGRSEISVGFNIELGGGCH